MPDPQDATDVVTYLVRQQPEIVALRLFKPRLPGLVQERMKLTSAELGLVNHAIAWRNSTRMPFWDSLLLQAESASVPLTNLLDAVQFHNSQAATSFCIPVEGDLCNRLRKSWESIGNNEAVVVSSSVQLANGNRLHIPMLDFHCLASEYTERLVDQVALRIWPAGGYLLASGKSYHFYGEGLLDDTGLVRFLASALMYAPIVDRVWLAHQLIEMACGLRISPRNSSHIILR